MPEVNEGEANLNEIKKAVAAAIEQVRGLKEDAKESNAAKAIVKAKLAAMGIPKAAFDQALKYLDWGDDARTGFDLAYQIVREAGGAPMRPDLFNNANQQTIAVLKDALGSNDMSENLRAAIEAVIVVLERTPL